MVKTQAESTTHSAPSQLMLVASRSQKMEMAFPFQGEFPVLSLDCAGELAVGKIICAVKVNEGGIDGNNAELEAAL